MFGKKRKKISRVPLFSHFPDGAFTPLIACQQLELLISYQLNSNQPLRGLEDMLLQRFIHNVFVFWQGFFDIQSKIATVEKPVARDSISQEQNKKANRPDTVCQHWRKKGFGARQHHNDEMACVVDLSDPHRT